MLGRLAAYPQCSADQRNGPATASARAGRPRVTTTYPGCAERQYRLAAAVREELEFRRVDFGLLTRLYGRYNPIPDGEAFVERAMSMFPRLCCGLASVYLQHRLGLGLVHRGSYRREAHTYLVAEGRLLDITADQFGGPRIYVGAVVPPWHSGRACVSWGPQNKRMKLTRRREKWCEGW